MSWLSSFIFALVGGTVASVVLTVGGTAALKSSQANTGSDKPPSDVNSVGYADE